MRSYAKYDIDPSSGTLFLPTGSQNQTVAVLRPNQAALLELRNILCIYDSQDPAQSNQNIWVLYDKLFEEIRTTTLATFENLLPIIGYQNHPLN
jgi:hypothetical protein